MAKMINTSYDNQFFYQWDGIAEKWVVDENKFDTDFPTQPQAPGTSLAAHIIQNVFYLTLNSDSAEIGSSMPGYDVVNRDAYQMVQLSLTAELGDPNDPKLYECYAEPDGTIKFYVIGEENSQISSSSQGASRDVLYSFTQASWKQKCDNVLVFGYDPPEKRFLRGPTEGVNIGYNLFDISNYVDTSDLGEEFQDEDLGLYPLYWTTGDYLTYEACPQYKEGYIEYSNIALSSQRYLNETGVFHYYDFEQIDGFVYKIRVPIFEQASTQVEFRQKTIRYYELDGFGELMVRDWKSNLKYVPSVCLQGEVVDEVGVTLPRSNEKKFSGVNGVYIIGYALKQIECDEVIDANFKFSPGPADFVVDLDSIKLEPFRLNEGEDYVVIKDQNSDYYKIVFSCNVNPNYAKKFGGKFNGRTCTYRVSRTSIYKFKTLADGTEVPDLPDCSGGKYDAERCTGVLRDGETSADDHEVLSGIIFPTGEGNTGYVVSKIIAAYEWDNPCVAVFDQKNRVTYDNLRSVNMEVFPVIVKNPPQFVSRNGEPLDPSEQLPDLNVGTVEDIYARDYQMAMSSMENADIRVTLPFLNQEGCDTVSAMIKDLQSQEIEVTTYVCSPSVEPILGTLIDDKTINSIEYSYQDSSQYFITVQAGPVWQGMTSWDNSLYQNGTERIQLEGIVRYVYDDNSKCVVQLEQLGLMECVNGQQQPLEAGDTVKVTVYNNPVRR